MPDALPSRPTWIDISQAIERDMAVWPGDPATVIESSPPSADHPYRSSSLRVSAHAGTHMDAPRHLDAAGLGIDAFPLELSLGPGILVDLRDRSHVDAEALDEALREGPVERVLLRTRRDTAAPSAASITSYTALDLSAAEALIKAGCRLVGTDAASIGAPDDEGARVHRALLRAGVWVLEGLVLHAARPGPVELLCLPLAISGCDGAPTRALLRQEAPADVAGR